MLHIRRWTLLTSVFILSACGWHFRSLENVPPALRTIAIESDDVYSPITAQLIDEFKGLGVQVVENSNQACTIVKLNHSEFSTDIPTRFYSGSATSYTYSLKVTWELVTNNGKVVIAPQELKEAQGLTYNTNEIGTPSMTPTMRRALTNRLTSDLFRQLTQKSLWSIPICQPSHNASTTSRRHHATK